MAHSPQHYHDAAASLRRLAESLPEAPLREELFKLARDYELLAARVQQRDADAAENEPASKPKFST